MGYKSIEGGTSPIFFSPFVSVFFSSACFCRPSIGSSTETSLVPMNISNQIFPSNFRFQYLAGSTGSSCLIWDCVQASQEEPVSNSLNHYKAVRLESLGLPFILGVAFFSDAASLRQKSR
ncbi:uncharacterized protein BO95DRAFT_193773 [Aspergillus brunneoviolaceus CBS 621.78]|uniref:Uncharacterized protein n=1 Tax=Aspergillus brunneoviolaceus CBS 621.78 TaxID=1450534 RepID=A0ACD1GLJ0_9EURO|nr:hypothetical protein BO95DRAFT_193773 [Aspergillus brunneoviolaceus CBS 621.78]RAH50190.1 hypothetical protein BO95DRAFT_193773 [Aspergillus brunneoviolaceus CBS 621.78]